MIRNIVIIFLLGTLVFSIHKYTTALKEKYELTISLGQANERIAVLAKEPVLLKEEKQKMSGEISRLKDYLRASNQRLSRLFLDYAAVRKNSEEAGAKISLLKAENNAFLGKNNELLRENESLRIKLSSIKEVKNAFLELRKQAPKVMVQIQEKTDAVKTAEGNRGFLVKDGEITYPAKVKIEVIPATVKK